MDSRDGVTKADGGEDKELGETLREWATGGWRGVDGDLGKMGAGLPREGALSR